MAPYIWREDLQTMRDVAFHKISLSDLLHIFGLKPDCLTNGLTEHEVKAQRKEFGANVFSEKKNVPILVALLRKYCQPFNLLLLVAAALSFVLYVLDRSDYSNICLSLGILFVSVLNTLLEFYQEYKTNELLRGFEKLVPSICTVFRDSSQISVNAADLVVGDLVSLKVGDKAPADVRLLTATKLTVDNSSLTGESVPVTKKSTQDDLYDRVVFERNNKVASAVQSYERKISPKLRSSDLDNNTCNPCNNIKEFAGSRPIDPNKPQSPRPEIAPDRSQTGSSSFNGQCLPKIMSKLEKLHNPTELHQKSYQQDFIAQETLTFESGDQNTSILSFESQISNQAQKGRPFTEESAPQKGNTPQNPGEYERATNMVFSGDLITTGKGTGIVVATGNSTLLGKIASMTVSDSGKQNELTAEIDAYVRRLGLIALAVSIIFYAIAVYNGFSIKENLIFCVGIFIAFVPQGLPATVTILLSIAAKQMARVNVLVKDLRAVETLGAVSLLATDKTGTLTMGNMKVQAIWDGINTLKVVEGRVHDLKNGLPSVISQKQNEDQSTAPSNGCQKNKSRKTPKEKFENAPNVRNCVFNNVKQHCDAQQYPRSPLNGPIDHNLVHEDIKDGVSRDTGSRVCNEGDMVGHSVLQGSSHIDSSQRDPRCHQSPLKIVADACKAMIGPGTHSDPTERALKAFAENYTDIGHENIVYEEPFDSNTKLHAAVVENSGKYRLVVKGAPDRLIKHAVSYGNQKSVDESFMKRFHTVYESFASLGQRVVAVAEREMNKHEVDLLINSDSVPDASKREGKISNTEVENLPKARYSFQNTDMSEQRNVSTLKFDPKTETDIKPKSIKKIKKESQINTIGKYVSNIFAPKQPIPECDSTQQNIIDPNSAFKQCDSRPQIRNLTTDQIFSKKKANQEDYSSADQLQNHKTSQNDTKNDILKIPDKSTAAQKDVSNHERNQVFDFSIGSSLGPSHGEANLMVLPKESTVSKDNLHFLGLLGIVDPPKAGVRDAVLQLRLAGIQVVMVTGDHPLTATNIARRTLLISGRTKSEASKILKIPTDLVKPEDYEAEIIHGDEIDLLLPSDWERIFKRREVVFARTSPAQKMRIVEMYQKIGHIVGVSGDGVNDAPALRKANLGIAMNTTGSDVSKEAAHMILKDDNFASIVFGVHLGRLVFCNLRKSVRYLLSHITPQVVPFLLFVGLGIPTPMSAVLLMLIDLFTEFFPSIALAWEPCEGNLMVDMPRKHAAIVSHGLQNEICEISIGYGEFSEQNTSQSGEIVPGYRLDESPYAIDKRTETLSIDRQNVFECAQRQCASERSGTRLNSSRITEKSLGNGKEYLEKSDIVRPNTKTETYEIPPADDFNIQTNRSITKKIRPDNQGAQKSEYLCDTNTLSWAYFEAGVIITLGALASFFTTFILEGIPLSELIMSSKIYFKPGSPDMVVGGRKIDSFEQLDILHTAQSAYFIGILIGQAFNILVCKNSNGILTKRTIRNKLPFLGTLMSLAVGGVIVMTTFANKILMSKRVNLLTLIFPVLTGVVLLFWDVTRKKLRRRFDIFGIHGAHDFLGVYKVKRKYLPAPPIELAP